MKNYDELMASINEKANTKISQRKRQRKIFLLSTLSLCLIAVISIGAFSLMPKTLDAPLNNNLSENVNTSLKGLEVENYKLSDIQTGVEADRIGAMKLSDFFQNPYSPDMFVYVRVLDTKQWEDKSDNFSTLKQTSSTIVLGNVWSKIKDIPEIIIVEQHLSGGCMGDEKTNMIRKDGVYLLPLMKDKNNNDEKWYINFDLDVLFEVDYEGKIWSHSQFEKFNIYDGKDASVLSDDITVMTSNENFSSAITPLGQMVANWGDNGALVEVTVSNVEGTEDKWGSACYRYTFGDYSPVSTTNNQNIGAISYKDSNIELEIGSKYLIMLDYSEDGPYIENNRVARVNDNGTISPINNDGGNVFMSFDGYTIEQIKTEIENAIAWRNQFGEK